VTAKELSENIGKTGSWTVNAGAGVVVEVKVEDARVMFGRVDFLITPVAGSGTQWIDSQFVKDLK
jgi:hypothetical protein